MARLAALRRYEDELAERTLALAELAGEVPPCGVFCGAESHGCFECQTKCQPGERAAANWEYGYIEDYMHWFVTSDEDDPTEQALRGRTIVWQQRVRVRST